MHVEDITEEGVSVGRKFVKDRDFNEAFDDEMMMEEKPYHDIMCAYDGNRCCSPDCAAISVFSNSGCLPIIRCQRGNIHIGNLEK